MLCLNRRDDYEFHLVEGVMRHAEVYCWRCIIFSLGRGHLEWLML